MKQILLILAVLLAFTFEATAQKAWVPGDIKGTPAYFTGGPLLTLADTAKADTTNAANTIYSAVFTGNSISLKKVLVGYVILDTAKVTTSTGGLGGPVVSMDVQGSWDGTNFQTVVDSAISAKRFNSLTVRTGGFNFGTADLSTYKFPYWRYKLRTTGTLSAVGTWPKPGTQAAKLKYILVPLTN